MSDIALQASVPSGLKTSRRDQLDREFLQEFQRFERVYCRRKARFQSLQQHHDVSNGRLFVLSDQEPWKVFGCSSSSKVQRRRLVFERTGIFPVLHESCCTGNLDNARTLLETPGVCVLSRDVCGRIALHHAVINEQFKIVKRLLRRRDGALQVHSYDNSHRTALHYALEKMEILSHGDQCEGGQRCPALKTVEMRAKSRRYRSLWKLADQMLRLVHREVLQADRAVEGGESGKALDLRCRGDMWDACRSGDLERLETIVQVYGYSPEDLRLSELKWTLLHEACENDQLGIAHFLLSTLGMSIVAQDTSGCTALHCAARRGCLEICQLLLDKVACAYADVDVDDDNEGVDELVLCQDTRGRTALHWSLLNSCNSHSQSAVAAFLALSCTAALHIGDEDGVTPLHLAIWRGNVEIVQQFITIGANVCAPLFTTTDKREENHAKASWAPCGLVFQHQRLLTSFQKAGTAINGGRQIVSSKDVRKLECVQHPVEALWYWAHRSSVQPATRSQKVALDKEDTRQDDEMVSTDETLGCLKYGGWCARCKPAGTDTLEPSTKIMRLQNFYESVLPPLLLALRVCALNGHFGLMVSHRVSVIELLLMSGAHPDGADGDDSDSLGDAKRAHPRYLSTIGEGLRASLRCPQVIPMLLLHGAIHFSIDDLIRCSSLASPIDNVRIENVLCQLNDASIVASNCDLLVVLFERKYFRVLSAIVESWPSSKAEKEAARGDDGENNLLISTSPWKCILESLLSRGKQRRKAYQVQQINSEHLIFLCGFAQTKDQESSTEAKLHEEDKLPLLEYCLDQYLRCRTIFNASNLGRRQESTGRLSGESEHVVFNCIHILFAHWKLCESNNEKIVTKAVDWLGDTISHGFFECAMILLNTQHQSRQKSALLGTVFEHYAKAVAARSYRGSDQVCPHRSFLIACVENLLKVNQVTPASEEQMDPSPACAEMSVRAIVQMCAYNLSFSIIKRSINLFFPNDIALDGNEALSMIRMVRVAGRTMVQWVVVYSRSDVMQLLLMRFPIGIERSVCWSGFVGALSNRFFSSSGKEKQLDQSSFIDKLFSLYVDNVKPHLSSQECDELLLGLVVKCAVPNDCVPLMERLMECWRAGKSMSDENEQVSAALTVVPILHTICQWNAIRIAEYCLYRDNSGIEWRQIFTEQVEKRHDVATCTPLELCRLLGHSHLYSLLCKYCDISSNIDKVEPQEKADGGKELFTQQFGLLRTVLCINEADTTKRCSESKPVIARQQTTSSQKNRWEVAVALNQVSYLQAMALTKGPVAYLGTTVHHLILIAIKHGSLDALRWLLEENYSVDKILSEPDGIECLYAAAKHSGDVYAEMTELLLANGLSPGRLSGDGMGIPLLHRAACFSNASLASRTMTTLLKRPDCDVNALDAFGNTATTYALAAGRLQNACFLMQRSTCRLEAEYEGQSCFYYVLHIIPSFVWRTMIRELLVTKRSRAFLHCDADNKTCGCKSFENPRDGVVSDEMVSRPCGFCGHEFMCHRIVPLPSWFRDQYDTYVAEAPPRKRLSSYGEDGEDDKSGDELSRNGPPDEDSQEDEEIVLENTRGRLDVELLERITVIRYGDIANANGLVVSAACEPIVSGTKIVSEPMEKVKDKDLDCESLSTNGIAEMETMDLKTMVKGLPDSSTDARDEMCAIESISDRSANSRAISNGVKLAQKLTDYPSSLRSALMMIHTSQCTCQMFDLITSQAQLAYYVVSRWVCYVARANMRKHQTQDINNSRLRSSESPIVTLASIEPAFQHWRQVSQSKETISAAVGRKPVASGLLKNVLSQWRYAKEFSAFQRWKNHIFSAEVTHHRLATRLDRLEADMRHNRFVTLHIRQQQLQDATRGLMVSPTCLNRSTCAE